MYSQHIYRQQSCNIQAREKHYYRLQFLCTSTVTYTGLLHRRRLNIHSKTKGKDLPSAAVESPSHDRQRCRAWFRPPAQPANPLPHPSSGRAGPPDSRHRCASRPRLHQQAACRTTSAGPRERERERERKSAEPRRRGAKKRALRGREGFRTRERGRELKQRELMDQREEGS